MSCDGWSVGDRCEVASAFRVIQRQMNGPDIIHDLMKGDEGRVERIVHDNPHYHWLVILWKRLQKTLSVPQEQFQYLKKA